MESFPGRFKVKLNSFIPNNYFKRYRSALAFKALAALSLTNPGSGLLFIRIYFINLNPDQYE